MTAAPLADLLANSGPRVTFWQCIIRTHSQRRGVVTVERDEDGTARCTYPGCEVTSVETTRYARAAAEVATERAAATLTALAELVAPQWRHVETDLPDVPMYAWVAGRNWAIDRVREVLAAGSVPGSRPIRGTIDADERSRP